MSYEFGPVRPSTTEDLRISKAVFSDFLHEVSHKVRKVTKPDFLKKSPLGQGGPKSHNGPKMRFLRF